ncbi:MAG: glycoside hydrolase family 5 protein [Clostridia bacterium]|nr:glycoside hydrolase family 5 protein [Clostridia bacterium]
MRFLRYLLALSFALLFSFLCIPTASLASEEEIVVPEISTKNFEIPESEAMSFVRALGAGWNLGNTMDAIDGAGHKGGTSLETYWCRAKTTREMIHEIAEAGFQTIRIPVSWHNHVTGDDDTIDPEWLSRVREIADWALEEGMYVIVNVHHDNHLTYGYYPDSEHLEQSRKYLGSIWRQMAECFQDADEHLILESLNEPRLVDTANEWWFDRNSAVCQDAAACINELNQLFVDTVRLSGGYNATRYLMVTPYAANCESANPDWFVLPTDTIADHLIVSYHAYSPYSFALDLKGTKEFSLTNYQQTAEVVSSLNAMYNWYVTRGIPVVLGEYGALHKDNLQARVDLTAFYVAQAASRGIPCLWWDNNAFQGSGEKFGLFLRQDLTWPFPEIVEAIMKYKLK